MTPADEEEIEYVDIGAGIMWPRLPYRVYCEVLPIVARAFLDSMKSSKEFSEQLDIMRKGLKK